MRLRNSIGLLSVVAMTSAVVAAPVQASAQQHGNPPSFNHVATFDVRENAGSQVSEIVAATSNGKILAYTDSASELIGLVDIADPSAPSALGTVAMGGEPTSVSIKGTYALVGVNTSTVSEVACLDDGDASEVSYISEWSGELAIVDVEAQTVIRTLALPGQPDSVAISPDGRFAAIAIENERNEEVSDGLIPQGGDTDGADVPPDTDCGDVELTATGVPVPGSLVIVDLRQGPNSWSTRVVDLTGVADFAPSDPEPEFVDINAQNQAVLTLQENNHIAVVNLKNGQIVRDFSAGSTTLTNLDITEDGLGPQETGLINFTEGPTVRRREPDSVTWLPGNLIGTANEGDYEDASGIEGGSRGFTVFTLGGTVRFDSGMSFEYASASAGHYNEARSENKGGEPESIEYGEFNGSQLLFVGAERANVVGVYHVGPGSGRPELLQTLPTGIGPEGLLAIPSRNLLVAANETSEGDIPAMITIYQGDHRVAASYPGLYSSNSADGTPIPWVAMSGLAGDPSDADTIFGVSDSYLANGFVYPIGISGAKGVITDRIEVTDPNGVTNWVKGFFPDFEGIAVAPEGGFWMASEGRVGDRPDAIIRTDPSGVVLESIELPADLVAGATSSGFEGVAVTGSGGSTEFVYAVVQREWGAGTGGVLADPANTVKIARWDGSEWAFVSYPKSAPVAAGWVGLSEITLLPDGQFAIIERDNQLGNDAIYKQVYTVDLAGASFTTDLTTPLPVVAKTLLVDVLDQLANNSVLVPDKLEGFSVSGPEATVHIVTDNDGLDEALGQTVFLRLGLLAELDD